MSKITAVYQRRPGVCTGTHAELEQCHWQEYAKQQGYTDLKFYEDICRRDSSIGSRPAMKQLKAEIEQENVERVLVKSLSRIGGNLIDVMLWIRWLREKGVCLYAQAEGLSFTGETGNSEENARQDMILALLYAIAEEESRNKNNVMMPP